LKWPRWWFVVVLNPVKALNRKNVLLRYPWCNAYTYTWTRAKITERNRKKEEQSLALQNARYKNVNRAKCAVTLCLMYGLCGSHRRQLRLVRWIRFPDFIVLFAGWCFNSREKIVHLGLTELYRPTSFFAWTLPILDNVVLFLQFNEAHKIEDP